MFDRNAIIAQMRRDRDEINRLVATLTPVQADRWDALRERYEYFDGETEIELDYLRDFIAKQSNERPLGQSTLAERMKRQ